MDVVEKDLHCYFDAEKNLCKCVAEPQKHCGCKYFDPSDIKPCMHFRPDLGHGCDNRKAQFEAYVQSKK